MRADYLVLADGRRIDGKILSESAKEVRIKTSTGELVFPRASIKELKREKTRDEVYAERLAACRRSTIKAMLRARRAIPSILPLRPGG